MELVAICILGIATWYIIAVVIYGGSKYLHQEVRDVVKDHQRLYANNKPEGVEAEQARKATATAYWQEEYQRMKHNPPPASTDAGE